MPLPYDPLGWLLVSGALYIVATNAYRRLQQGAQVHERLHRLLRVIDGAAPVILFVYYIAPPYTLLLMGELDPRQAGIIGLDWQNALTVASLLGLAALVLLLLGRRHYRRSLAPDSASEAGAPISLVRQWWRAVFQQAHWAFYRSVLAGLGAYQAVFAALAVSIVEWLLNPAWRAGWAQAAQTEERALDLAFGLTTATVFIYTGNFWVTVAVQVALVTLLAVGRRMPGGAPRAGRAAAAGGAASEPAGFAEP